MKARAFRRSASNVFFALGVALLVAAILLILSGPVDAQTIKPKPKEEQTSSTQSVYYPDPCDLVEPGSWSWYLMLCMIK